jgi:hypothetical protein
MAENMLKMGMTAVQIDTQVLAADLERLFSGVLLADPQELLSSNPADLNDIMMDMVAVASVTVFASRVILPCYLNRCCISIVSCASLHRIPTSMLTSVCKWCKLWIQMCC